MSSENKVLRLNEMIKQCENEMRTLLQEKEKERWSEDSKSIEQTITITEAQLRRLKQCHLILTSGYEKEFKDLKEKIKYVEEFEAKLKVILERSQVSFTEFKILKDRELREIERRTDEVVKKIMSDESHITELHKRREELKRRLEHLDNFCAAMYSTLKSKDSKKHI